MTKILTFAQHTYNYDFVFDFLFNAEKVLCKQHEYAVIMLYRIFSVRAFEFVSFLIRIKCNYEPSELSIQTSYGLFKTLLWKIYAAMKLSIISKIINLACRLLYLELKY